MEYKTGLWKKTSSKGTTYYFGQRDNLKVTLFKNDKRPDHPNDPDLNVIVELVEEQDNPKPDISPATDDIPF